MDEELEQVLREMIEELDQIDAEAEAELKATAQQMNEDIAHPWRRPIIAVGEVADMLEALR